METSSDDDLDIEEKHMALNTVIRENHNSSITLVKTTNDPECGNIIFTLATKQLNIYDNHHLGYNLDLMYQHSLDQINVYFTSADWYRIPLDYGIAVGDNTGVLKVFSVGYSKVVYQNRIFDSAIVDIKENISDLGYIFTRAHSGKCIVWKKSENELVKIAEYNMKGITCCSWYNSNQLISMDDDNIFLWNVPEEATDKTISNPTQKIPKPENCPAFVNEIICYKDYIIINSLATKGVYVLSYTDFKILYTYVHNRHIEFFPMCIDKTKDIIIISSSNELTALTLKLTEYPLRFPKFRGKATSITVTYDGTNSIIMTTDEGMIWRYRLIEEKKDIKEEAK